MIKTKYISKVGKDYKVSEHFTLGEFASPGYDMVKYSTTLLARLEKIRSFFGGSVNIISGYRTKPYNALVGGASNSAHLFGQAADILVKDSKGRIVSPKKVCLYLECVGWKWGIGMMENTTHIDTKYPSRMDETAETSETVNGYYFLDRHNLTFAEYFDVPSMVVSTKSLNVRKSPGGDVVRKLKKGEKVHIYKTVKDDSGNSWAKINFAKKEYVAKWLLR